MQGATHDTRAAARRPRDPATVAVPEPEAMDVPPTWRGLGLETMASLLVLSLRRLGPRGFEAWCQWPRHHPLNERATAVTHHPLIMVESVRQIAAALELHHLPRAVSALEPDSIRWGVTPQAQPYERGVATAVLARVAVGDVMLDAGRLAGYRVFADFLHSGLRFGSCTIRMAVRQGAATPGVHAGHGLLYPAAAAVGAAAEPDVMLGRAPRGRLVIAPKDPCHPVLTGGRSSRLTAAAVLEAGRQAALLTCGMTAAAVSGLSVDILGPVPYAGAFVDVTSQPLGRRFVVLTRGQAVAVGTVGLLRP
ncbi:hypothetical protein ACGFNQ_25140 [Streptomyces asoensis]|uniref:hypothetical protein n=1 Tax=Streptomyces asoensis TaxID=249586 RepID=UPI0037208D5F